MLRADTLRLIFQRVSLLSLEILLPLERPNGLDARKDGTEIRFPCDHLHSAPPHSGNLDWLEGRGIQVICCGDQGQPPPIAGEMPHDWLRGHATYYEEVEVDHRAKDPLLKASRSESAFSPTGSSAERCERRFLVASGENASWRPGSHVISS